MGCKNISYQDKQLELSHFYKYSIKHVISSINNYPNRIEEFVRTAHISNLISRGLFVQTIFWFLWVSTYVIMFLSDENPKVNSGFCALSFYYSHIFQCWLLLTKRSTRPIFEHILWTTIYFINISWRIKSCIIQITS